MTGILLTLLHLARSTASRYDEATANGFNDEAGGIRRPSRGMAMRTLGWLQKGSWLVGLVLLSCGGNPPDEEFERTKQEVQRADEQLHEAVRDIELGRGQGMTCPKAQGLQKVIQTNQALICRAADRYTDYAPFRAKCDSTTEEAREAPQTVSGICSGSEDDGF